MKNWVESFPVKLLANSSVNLNVTGKVIRCIRSSGDFYLSFSRTGAETLMREGLEFFTDGFDFLRLVNKTNKDNEIVFLISEYGVKDNALSLSETVNVDIQNKSLEISNLPAEKPEKLDWQTTKGFVTQGKSKVTVSVKSFYYPLLIVNKSINKNGIVIRHLDVTHNNNVRENHYMLFFLSKQNIFYFGNRYFKTNNASDIIKFFDTSYNPSCCPIKSGINHISLENYIIEKGFNLFFVSNLPNFIGGGSFDVL